MRIAIASDHAGYDLKQLLLNRLAAEPDLTFMDLGTDAPTPPVDYPDFARAAAEAVARGDADRAIVVCGSGAGACIAADKVPGARAFYAGDTYTAHQGVEHDDGDVLCLGERAPRTPARGPSLCRRSSGWRSRPPPGPPRPAAAARPRSASSGRCCRATRSGPGA